MLIPGSGTQRDRALGTIEVTMLTYPRNMEGSITVIGERGSVKVGGTALNRIDHWEFAEYDDIDREAELLKAASNPLSVYGSGHKPYYDNVVKALRHEAAADTDGREGRKSLELILAIYESARSECQIALPLRTFSRISQDDSAWRQELILLLPRARVVAVTRYDSIAYPNEPRRTNTVDLEGVLNKPQWGRSAQRLKTLVSARASSGFARGVAILAGGSALGQGIVIASSPLVARLYQPSDFGVLAVYSSIISILLVIASWRYELAIPLPDSDAAASALVVLSFGILAGVTGLVALLVHFFGFVLVRLVNAPALEPYLWLLPIGVAGAGAYQILNYWAVRKKSFGAIARTRLTQSIGKVFTQVGMWWLGMGAVGLLAADEVGRAGGVGSLAIAARSSSVAWRGARAHVKEVARRYIKFPLVTTWAGLLNISSLQLPALLLSAKFGTETTGYYSLGFRLLGAPLALIGASIGQVLLARAAEIADDHSRVRGMTEQSAIALFAVGLPPFLLIGFAGRSIFSFVFGPDWSVAGYYAQLLAPWFLFWLVASPLSTLLTVREWQWSALAFTAGELFARVISVMIGASRGSPTLAIALLSGSGVLVSLLSIARFLQAGYSSPKRLVRPAGRIMALGILCLAPVAAACLLGGLVTAAILAGICVPAYYFGLLCLSPFGTTHAAKRASA